MTVLIHKMNAESLRKRLFAGYCGFCPDGSEGHYAQDHEDEECCEVLCADQGYLFEHVWSLGLEWGL